MRLLALLLLSGIAWGADSFPAIEGESLLGAKVALPDAAKGHPTAVVIGFTHASQNQIQPWTLRLQSDFGAYSIAVLEDAPRLVRGMATSGIRGSVPKNLRDHFLIVVKGEKLLKEAAGFERPDDAYVILMDGAGAIQWRFHGPLTDSAYAELKTKATELE
jgi:hypothetical protein